MSTPATASAPQLFLGRVMHRRLRPRDHVFHYPTFFVQLPLRRLDEARCAVFGVGRWNLLSFQPRDHGPRDGSALDAWMDGLLRERGLPVDGDIVLHTMPRILGYAFNPVSFWYCHDAQGALRAVLAEVRNTFGQRHNYLLHHADGRAIQPGDELTADKALHVSPFNQIQGGYRFRFERDTQRPVAWIDYDDDQGPLLQTALAGRASGWSVRALLGALARMPMMTLGVVARIHWQALILWIKGVPFHGRDGTPAASGKELAS
ncbi:DUF1365 domain-containing protein [Amphibiibacter pelophylacis]|uniref:DUF1365 domain-containing protein n=1 Tax=Amphibiibacter pelophylacis TaxID=1799477 RepID=A0ACC6P208_9BURK